MKTKIMSGLKKMRTRMLLGLFGIALVALVVNLVFVNIYSAEDQVFIQKASDLRVLSQEIAKNASAVISGSQDAVDGLESSSREFEESWNLINNGQAAYVDSGIGIKNNLPAKGPIINSFYPNIQILWGQVKGNVDLILQNTDSIQELNSIATAIAVDIPQLQREYDEVVNTLIDNSESISTIAVAQRQAWLAERIALNLNRIASGEQGAGQRVDQFQRDINLFSSNHEALLEGDVSIGISRVEDAAARQRLDEISTLFGSISNQSSNVVAVAPEIASASNAVDEIVNYSEQLLFDVTSLSQYFSASRGNHLASPLLGYILLLGILLITSLYGLEVISKSRKAVKKSAEENQRKNSAVLKLLEEISDLGEGDLTVKATVSEDFTGAIADSINYAIGQLKELVLAITDVTVQVQKSTKSSEKTVRYLADASDRQATRITSVSESVQDMEKNINKVSMNAQKSLDVAKKSVTIATGGADVVKSTINGMDTIRGQIQETAKRVKRLGESSQEIGGFVSLINDIADRTNTLSLNAAIQAAMAGEAGKGFGVVADEVHALAERSTDATRQIESLVKVIQRDINEAVFSMEQTTSEVVQGTKLAQGAGDALDDIEKVSKELAELVETITQAARSQTKTASEITESMSAIQKITKETSSGTKASSEFIFELGNLTERLHSAVAGFSLDYKSENGQSLEGEAVKVISVEDMDVKVDKKDAIRTDYQMPHLVTA